MSVDRIFAMVREGRATPKQGAMLLQLRRELAWRRLPWWDRALRITWRVLFEW